LCEVAAPALPSSSGHLCEAGTPETAGSRSAAILVPLAPSGRLVACLPRTLRFGIQRVGQQPTAPGAEASAGSSWPRSNIRWARPRGERRRVTVPLHADNHRVGPLAVPTQADTGECAESVTDLGIGQRIEPSLVAPATVSLPDVGDLDSAGALRTEHAPRVAVRLLCGIPRRRRSRWCRSASKFRPTIGAR